MAAVTQRGNARDERFPRRVHFLERRAAARGHALGLLALNLLLWGICYALLKSGWKIKA
jgi:hypothetical protein